MKKQISNLLAITVLSAFAWSCNQSDPKPKGDYVQGVFAINEGNFTSNDGSISFFARENTTSDADIFSTVNSRALNGGIQGYSVFDDKGVILVDNSASGQDKVEIVDANTMESLASIGTPDIENPRDVVAVSESKVYVSCWGNTGTYPNFFISNGYVAVIDLETNKVTKRIAVSKGIENMIYDNGKLFVGRVSYSGSNYLTVINTATNEVIRELGFNASPTPIGVDANGNLWVQAGLDLAKINPTTLEIVSTMKISSDASKTAGNFAFSNDRRTLYFVLSYYDANYVTHGATYKYGINESQVNVSTPVINRVFTGLAVDPLQGLIYAAVTPSYAQAGYAIRYRTDGTLVDSIKVGIAPTGFYFR